MADVAGVGREFPLSMEKLSPILAFYVTDGLMRGAERSYEILRYGGMGHTAGVHTRSREAAVRFGSEMPASRVTVNTPTTHGAIGFSTALPPSMTLGCGSWGGNVTSDNVSPLHLLDIKRVAFEVRPVQSKRPASSVSAASPAPPAPAYAPAISAAPQSRPVVGSGGGKINREDIAAIVDKFLAGRQPDQPAPPAPQPRDQAQRASSEPEAEAGSMYAGPNQSGRQRDTAGGNGGRTSAAESSQSSRANFGNAAQSANGAKTVDFVSEDDVKRAIQKGEKIYINAKTIITPAARDIGEPAEVFAKG
jgi:acetaldehyde dehydrogenase (acetylating)